MERKFLEELGLEKETIDKVMLEHGKTVNDTKAKADKADELKTQLEDYKQQISERDTQLEELKKVDAEGLQQKIDELQKQNETATSEYQEKLEKQAKDFAIESALRDAKARNPKIAKGALDDLESITFKDGKLIGFDEQLKAIQETESYLFGEVEPAGLKGRKPHESNEPPQGVTKEKFNQMGYKERIEFKQSNPEQYEQLTKI